MSRWNRRGRGRGWGWYPPPAPKLPAPARGIKVKKIGSTWWGQRWIAALERLSRDYSNRLERGRSYARAGRVHDLEIRGGVVTAHVTGSRATPYKITLHVAPLSAAAWQKATEQLAQQALFAAELLAGRMPEQIDEAFLAAKVSLFPERAADLRTDCSCPDWANPCKHIAATHYVLGEAFDKDPFLLFELRGRGRERVLRELRALRAKAGDAGAPVAGRTAAKRRPRGEAASDVAAAPAPALVEVIPTVSLAGREPAAYEAWTAPLDPLRFRIEAAVAPAALLRLLGAPSCWSDEQTPAELFAPLCAGAAALARELAVRVDGQGDAG